MLKKQDDENGLKHSPGTTNVNGAHQPDKEYERLQGLYDQAWDDFVNANGRLTSDVQSIEDRSK